MQLTLNSDVIKWLDETRDKQSRQAFINYILKQAMLQYTSNTSGTYGIQVTNGDIKSPNQN